MKLEKKHMAIIGVIVAIILVWFFLRKKTSEKNLVKRNIISSKPQAESNWEPEYRDINKDKAALSGISLANISTFGTPI